MQLDDKHEYIDILLYTHSGKQLHKANITYDYSMRTVAILRYLRRNKQQWLE